MGLSIVYLNGQYIPLEQASVSVLDRGFLFGDGIYEVIPFFAGRLFRFHEHIVRLQRSLQEVGIIINKSEDEWQSLIHEVVKKNHIPHGSVYLQITRGIDDTRQHLFSDNMSATIFAMVSELPPEKNHDQEKGIHVMSMQDFRWKRCDIKATTLLANCMAKQEAKRKQCDEVIFINEGYAVEGASSNLFIVKNDIIKTPPESECILTGVTRNLVIELTQKQDLQCQEDHVTLNDVYQADEVWLTSSTKEIRPVIQVDEQVIGKGVPGNLWKKAMMLYTDFKHSLYRGEFHE